MRTRPREVTMGDKKVRVAIIGVGNCANSLVQGVEYYRGAADDEQVLQGAIGSRGGHGVS